VATPSESADSGTQASNEHEVSLAKSSQFNTGSPNVPTPSSGRLSCLVQRYETEGFSKDVANQLVAATRSSTSKTYESSWRRWCIWCAPRKVNPLSAALENILSFLAECYKEGLHYRSINVLRSALSSIHPMIDNHRIGQHAYVINLLRGILNNRPPKPRTHTLGICMWLQTASRKWEQIKYIIVSKTFELETCNIIRNNMSKTGILPYPFGS
jgi:hypothetical protein